MVFKFPTAIDLKSGLRRVPGYNESRTSGRGAPCSPAGGDAPPLPFGNLQAHDTKSPETSRNAREQNLQQQTEFSPGLPEEIVLDTNQVSAGSVSDGSVSAGFEPGSAGVPPAPTPALNEAKAVSIGVLAAKGAAGASTLALNLALAYSAIGQKTTVIDANLQEPTLSILLGRQPQNSMLEFFARSQDYDEAVFQSCSLAIQSSNKHAACSVMSAQASGESAAEFDLSQMAEDMVPLQASNDVLIVDLPRYLDRHLVTLMDRLDCIVLVFEPTVISLAAARRWLRIFSELSYPPSKFQLVLNRAGAGKVIESDLGSLIGGNLHRIPNAFRLMEECMLAGQPAFSKNPREKYSLAVSELARKILSTNSSRRA